MDYLKMLWIIIKRFRLARNATNRVEIELPVDISGAEAYGFIYFIQGMRLIKKNISKELQSSALEMIRHSKMLTGGMKEDEVNLILYGMGYIQGLLEEGFIDNQASTALIKGLINIRFLACLEPDKEDKKGRWYFKPKSLEGFFFTNLKQITEEDFRDIAFPRSMD
jgi:hypothetical protein